MFIPALEKINHIAAKKISPFLEEILIKYQENIHSIHVTGTAVTEDFDNKSSDINSIFILKEMDLKFLELIAPLGKKYGKDKIAAPLIMTPEYIRRSIDVFPVEFLNFKLIHATVFGEDIFENLDISSMDLRRQCERELKVKLIWLRQNYISYLGNIKTLAKDFANSISGYIPLFRGIISLLGKQPPVMQADVISLLSEASGINMEVFLKVLWKKHREIQVSKEDLGAMFSGYYTAIEKLGKIVDEIK